MMGWEKKGFRLFLVSVAFHAPSRFMIPKKPPWRRGASIHVFELPKIIINVAKSNGFYFDFC